MVNMFYKTRFSNEQKNRENTLMRKMIYWFSPCRRGHRTVCVVFLIFTPYYYECDYNNVSYRIIINHHIIKICILYLHIKSWAMCVCMCVCGYNLYINCNSLFSIPGITVIFIHARVYYYITSAYNRYVYYIRTWHVIRIITIIR